MVIQQNINIFDNIKYIRHEITNLLFQSTKPMITSNNDITVKSLNETPSIQVDNTYSSGTVLSYESTRGIFLQTSKPVEILLPINLTTDSLAYSTLNDSMFSLKVLEDGTILTLSIM